MTRDQALARIDAIESDPAFQSGTGAADDARKLVALLPERALAKMSEGWIRIQDQNPGGIEFFWSRSFNMFNPGNRITTFCTTGNETFRVELRGDPAQFDAASWQRSDDGTPMKSVLSLAKVGAQTLVEAVADYQVGKAG